MSEAEEIYEYGGELSLQDLIDLEGTAAFECAECHAVFKLVMEWATHGSKAHDDKEPSVIIRALC